MRKYRLTSWAIFIAVALCPLLQAQGLRAHLDGDRVHVSAPQLDFLSGRNVETLRNGGTVSYAFQLTAASASGGRTLYRAFERFAVSYDLWEERFSVVRSDPPARSASHLSAAAAAAWCVDAISVPSSALAAEKSFVLNLEIRVEEAPDEFSPEKKPGLTLAGLIDVFSRKPREEVSRWYAGSAPLRLWDLQNGQKTKRH
jgi:hypothetical protein